MESDSSDNCRWNGVISSVAHRALIICTGILRARTRSNLAHSAGVYYCSRLRVLQADASTCWGQHGLEIPRYLSDATNSTV